MSSSVAEIIRQEVPDWDDEVVATARFKAFSGQRSDWEPKFLFWRDLILKVARRLGLFIITASEVKNNWFNRGGLTPLCIENVLLEMYNTGEIIQSRDLVDPTGSRLSKLFKKVVNLMSVSRSLAQEEIFEDRLILRILLQERSSEIIEHLSESHWTSSCILTMKKFQSMCKGSNEATAILSYLSGCGKAHHLAISKMDFIEGVKVSLVSAAVSSISALDYDVLHLTWTIEKLQQQLDVIDQRCEMSRKSALASLKSRNKKSALRHVKHLKLASEGREKCTSLLNRVEEVLTIIANAESTKKVSEAIQIGAKAIKENRTSVEDVQLCLEELDETVASQKQVEEVLELSPLQTSTDDEYFEEEFKKLELEVGYKTPEVPITESIANASNEAETSQYADSLTSALSNLKLGDDAVKNLHNQESAESSRSSLPKNLKLGCLESV